MNAGSLDQTVEQLLSSDHKPRYNYFSVYNKYT